MHAEGSSPELLTETYDELRRLAASYLRAERRDHTLQPTALVHEAWCRLAAQQRASSIGRESFVAQAAVVMRRILVDHARARRAAKRGGGGERVTIDVADIADRAGDIDVLALDEALDRLRALSAVQASLVDFRFFGGLTLEEAAALLGIPSRAADREWACAKAWLFRALEDNTETRR
jgi:RNA polymerase sigma-70 factor, ECF subfamily